MNAPTRHALLAAVCAAVAARPESPVWLVAFALVVLVGNLAVIAAKTRVRGCAP